jgi:hypothetical protein
MKSFLAFLLCMILAFGSFGFARYHYIEVHSASRFHPFQKSADVNMTDPFFSADLVGSWVKDEWVFALAIPAVLIASGLALAARK